MLTPSGSLITMREPDSEAAEAFRILRTNISLRDFDKKIKVINVISAIQSESKSTTVLNIAYVFSQLGIRVLVIDLDLRVPTIHKKLLIRNKAGVTDVVGGKCSWDDAVIHYTENVDVVLSGTKVPFASELIESDSIRNFIEQKREEYDMIFIDCPPINLVADGIVVSSYCDGTLLCVASGKNEKKDLEKARDTLELADINVLGIIMTRVENKKEGPTNYYSSYGHYRKGYYKTEKK